MSILVSKVQKLALCSIIYTFTLLTLKKIALPPPVYKDKVDFKSLSLKVHVVEKPVVSVEGSSLNNCSAPAAQRVVIFSFYVPKNNLYYALVLFQCVG